MMQKLCALLAFCFVLGAIAVWHWTCMRQFPQSAPCVTQIDSCVIIRYSYGKSSFELSRNDADLENLLGIVKQALSGVPRKPLNKKTLGTLALLNSNGDILLEAALQTRALIVDGKAYDGSGADIAWLADEAWRQKTYYHDNGQLKAKGVHEKGMKHGLWIYYYENGTTESVGTYMWEKRVGKWLTYPEQGSSPTENWYLNDLPVSESEYRAAAKEDLTLPRPWEKEGVKENGTER